MKKLIVVVCAVVALSAGMAFAQPMEGFYLNGFVTGGAGTTNDQILNPRSDDMGNGINIIKTAGLEYNARTMGLGSLGNYGEFMFNYGLIKNDMNWVIKLNLGTTSDFDVYAAEIFTYGTGVLKAKPDASIWVGRRFYQRYKSLLANYEMLVSNGDGFGIDNLDLGFGALDLALVKEEYGADTCTDTSEETWACIGEPGFRGGYHAIAGTLRGIKITDDIALGLFANYGFYAGSDSDIQQEWSWGQKDPSPADNHPNGFQAGFHLKRGAWGDFDEIFFRYSHKVAESMTQNWLDRPSSQIGAFFQGKKEFAKKFRLEYGITHETRNFDDDSFDYNQIAWEKSSWTNLMTRGTYIWNERTSTALELGYDMVDFDARADYGDSGTNSSYAIGLAQNIHIGGGYWDRPVLTFSAVYGNLDTETTIYNNRHGADGVNPDWEWRHNPYITETGTREALTLAAHFEIWW